jgi:hypothetical protein
MRPLDGALRPIGRAIGTFTVVLVLAACSSNPSPLSPKPSGGQGSASSPATPGVTDPLDGTTWRNTFTCEDVAKTLERAGLQKYERNVLRGWDCDAAMHITLVFSNGEFSATSGGETLGPSPYQIVNDHTYVWEFLRNTYRVQGDRLIFSDTKIIAALYPYDPKIMPGEHALLVGLYTAVPFVRIG